MDYHEMNYPMGFATVNLSFHKTNYYTLLSIQTFENSLRRIESTGCRMGRKLKKSEFDKNNLHSIYIQPCKNVHTSLNTRCTI